ncbi:4-(cytidine 5'-diphospho)-2-C-methyl-D-erythritol kinase [Sediminicoccus sp. KRV36]|uniref:4-(cytidine 5'-diphospho)-2-C-methyl-D-erythritol kinase n=1 Tax=Sediminicoccus sp. KRV36 TaxID=3133721 RepID=UPI0020103C83|nr:4-(cytidine 5'-diphospho)-2-C-methyl-D-erythritol kinase [Sediminicoccus rosea]UPY36269.1 4-(cytidine 5'-diphospho)-2-C-methyl-D-erythritol kinase [Sediminicoccus rosea]
MRHMTEAAPAKVNLFLHVTGRRGDGYHLLDSLAVFGPAADALSATPAEALSLTLAGPFGATLAAEQDNLVLRAARALAAATGQAPAAALHLEKHLPVASGIGGGSADAAAALRLLNRLWGSGLDADALARIAAPLGADIPVCIASRPARMQGIGEVISAAPALPECGLLLVNPRVPVATPAVFRARQGAFSTPAPLPQAWPDAASMAADLLRLHNDLEAPALLLCPVIAEVLAALRATPGCLLARMSGSGATCFGLFATAAAARAAAENMPRDWWAIGGAPCA